MTASGRWAIRLPPQTSPIFYFITQGRCGFRENDDDAVVLHQGDWILSAKPVADLLFSEPDVEVVLSDDAFKKTHSVGGELRIGDPGQGPVTQVLGGVVVCNAANTDLLLELLPRFIHVCATDSIAARLRALVSMIREETADIRPGADAILSRLIEVMLIEMLRCESAAWFPHVSVLGGLSDPQLAKAIAEIHADVSRGWTIAELAQRAGMSRSVLARRFSEAVGVAPVEYLLRWRMALAKDALLHGGGGLEKIAAQVGYKSASAFSTAFRQRVGCPPGDYAANGGLLAVRT
ncbi:MAG: AraC-type DNA-binding protein [Rhizobium sp.]|nr:AraC-type DNA-binding protein [Rhizobium sp.]